jgi:hypothetical protein
MAVIIFGVTETIVAASFRSDTGARPNIDLIVTRKDQGRRRG